jgi:hypothetical protein
MRQRAAFDPARNSVELIQTLGAALGQFVYALLDTPQRFARFRGLLRVFGRQRDPAITMQQR